MPFYCFRPFGWNSRERCALTNAEQYFSAAGRLGD
jgi:Domain of unknown function (DUF3597)